MEDTLRLQAEKLLSPLGELDGLTDTAKIDRLNRLVQKSKLYSEIIADKLAGNESDPKRRKTDVLSMLTRKSQTAQPKLVSGGKLSGYQKEGLDWLINLYQNGLNGILADEMGLGKTIQCISFLCFLIEQGIDGPFLVVGPLSTISNWASEFKRFAPKVKVTSYIGDKPSRHKISLKGQVVLVSYELAIRDFSRLHAVNWKYLVVDEGHRLKNIDCLLIRILKKLDVQNRLLLTGTPLQNNLQELWALMNFILPDIFHDWDLFQQWFDFDAVADISKVDDHQAAAFINRHFRLKLLDSLHDILRPFILRRLKTEVLDLPPKREYLIHVELSDYQKKLYTAALDGGLLETITELYEYEYAKFNLSKAMLSRHKSNLARKELHEGVVQNLKALKLQNSAMQLRNICNSPYIYYEPFPIESNLTSFDAPPANKEELFIGNLISNSIKFSIVDQLLPYLTKSHKTLIFLQFTKTLDLLSDFLTHREVDHCRFDGSTSQEDRDQAIESFKSSPEKKFFLLSTRAGGLGINLVEADTVLIFDNDWNPQVDIQAIDRCHRIGQTKPVKIFRFVVRNSIEELLLIKNYSKRFLEKLVMQIGSVKKLDNYEIEFNNLVKLSKEFGFVGNAGDVDLDSPSPPKLLLEEEVEELMDRSEGGFRREVQLKNISVFEAEAASRERSG